MKIFKKLKDFNLKDLEKKIHEFFPHQKKIIFSYVLVDGKGKLRLTSENLKDQTGIMKDFYNDVRLEEFASDYIYDDNLNIIAYWLTIAFRLEYLSGNRNGSVIFNCKFSVKDNEWTVHKIEL